MKDLAEKYRHLDGPGVAPAGRWRRSGTM